MPALLFFTDPARTPDPASVAAALPRGAAIVLRTFGASGAEAQARELLAIARQRGLKLLIGQDAALALKVGADGVHLPERLSHRAGPIRRLQPGWLVTSAAHSLPAARGSGAHAVVISPALVSSSPSAGRPLGALRLAEICRATTKPAYALGGLNATTAKRLLGVELIGLAAVEGLKT